jgi:phosphate transport system permease protein
MFTGAAYFLPFLPETIWDQTMALSLHLFVVSTMVPGAPPEMPYGVALVLIGIVLLMNSISITFRTMLRRKKKW